ncbi:MAG: anthranilate phosphoribosyltransferase [Hyphomonadaceae bacterium]
MSGAALLDKLQARGLEASEVDAILAQIMDGQTQHDDVVRFLRLSIPYMAYPAWIAAGARALRARMLRVEAPAGAIDVCGTGGDGAHTLNISSAVAFVVAGCGVPVAKHGNRAMSSKSGAADVLEALGVKLTADTPTLERCLREAGVAFLFAQNHHPAMRHVAQARRELGQRSLFNLLGPLSNPAGVSKQLVGVFSADFVLPVAEALKTLEAERAWIVHGFGGLDELSGEGVNEVAELRGGRIRTLRIAAADAFLSQAPNLGLRGGDAGENASALRKLLSGDARGSDYAEVVQLNAAAALVAAGAATQLGEAARMASDSLHGGRALEALQALIDVSRSAP